MPAGTFYRATGRKKVKKPKKQNKQKITVRVRQTPASFAPTRVLRSALPDKFVSTLNYMDTLTLDPGVGGTIAVDRFIGNGMYDPYYLAGGHQPRGFDQLMTMYKKYCVTSCRLTVNFVGAPMTAYEGLVYGISLREFSATTENDYLDYIEPGNTVYQTCTMGGGDFPRLTYKYNVKKFHSLDKILDNGAYGGDATANPDKGANFHVWVGPVDKSTNIPPVHAICELQYRAVFRDPITVASS